MAVASRAGRAIAALALSSLLSASSCATYSLWSEVPQLHAWEVVGAGVDENGQVLEITASSSRC